MLTFAWYLLKVMLCSGILFGYYILALRNKKFHLYNRFYLLASVALSWLIPLVKINIWPISAQQIKVVNLLTVVATGDRYVEQADPFKWNWSVAIVLVAVSVSLIFLAQLIITIVKIQGLISSNPTKKWNNVYFIFTNAKGTPFSFFKYIFWNEQIDLTSSEGEQILRHELAHVQENHTADKLFLSLVLILGWYNPFMWLFRKELNMIHEFIADKKAVNEGDTYSFAAMLLKVAFPCQSYMLTNSFFHSPIKRRLVMLTSSKKTSFTYARRLATLPLLLFTCLLFAFTIKKEKAEEIVKAENAPTVNNANESPILDRLNPSIVNESNYQDTTQKKKRANGARISNEKGAEANSTQFEGEPNVTVKAANAEQLTKTLVVLDGKQMTWEEFEKKQIKPELIKSMNVLKGAAATTNYGEKGKNGVIEVTTKAATAYSDAQQKYLEQQRTYQGVEKKFGEDQAKYQQEQSNYKRIFTQVENPPQYSKGMVAFVDYINSNIQYPKEAIQRKIEGAVLVQFIVNEEGKLTDFKKISGKGYGLEEEAIRLLKNSGEWKPGVQNGHTVPVQIQQEVIFELPKKQ